MPRFILAGLLMLVMVVPAGASIVSNSSNSDIITITLTIGCYTNVYWNGPADENIVFNDIAGTGGDYYNTTLMGAYGTNTKASQDPYAEGYYESLDQAFFWLQSNCDVDMTVTPSGDLTHTDLTSTIPTWYTCSMTNNTGTADGFINGGVRVSDGTIPNDGMGIYAADADSNLVWELGGGTPAYGFYPMQHAFAMTGGAATANFKAFTEGTILFVARALRSGISDKAGTYTATIALTFAETTP